MLQQNKSNQSNLVKLNRSDAGADISLEIKETDIESHDLIVALLEAMSLTSPHMFENETNPMLQELPQPEVYINGERTFLDGLANLASCMEEDQVPILALAPGRFDSSITMDIFGQFPNRARCNTEIFLDLKPLNISDDRPVCGLVLPRSGWADRFGLSVSNSPGLIDNTYTGELLISVENRGSAFHILTPGTRIGQLILVESLVKEMNEVLCVKEDTRTDGGFGSTKLK